MKRIFYKGRVDNLKKSGLIYRYGRYSTNDIINNLYIGRSSNNKRLLVISDTSFHIELGYDEILFNFIKNNRNLKNLKTDGFWNYSICKNGEIFSSFNELIKKDIGFGQNLLQIEADKNFDGCIDSIDEETKKNILIKDWETNPYKNPYFLTDKHYKVLVNLIDSMYLEEMEYF